jgi:hypothetical protein
LLILFTPIRISGTPIFADFHFFTYLANLELLKTLMEHYALALRAFEMAGFVISYKKSDRPIDAAQSKKFLGFMMDTVSMRLFVPTDRLQAILRYLDRFFARGKFQTPRSVARVTGRLSAIALACGPP